MAQSTSGRALSFILRETIGDVLYFPVWWFTVGLKQSALSLRMNWLDLYDRLSLGPLLRAMGRPMYGDYTRTGRIISFFFRVLLVAVRAVLLLGWSLMAVVFFLARVFLPIIALAMLARQFFPI